MINSDDESLLFDVRIRFCYVYAVIKKLKKLVSYITNTYGIRYKVAIFKRTVVNTIKGLGKVILSVGSLGLVPLIKNISNKIKEDKFPKDKGQLNQKSRAIYEDLSKKKIGELKTLLMLTKKDIKLGDINSFLENRDEEFSSAFLKAIYARLITNTPLMNLFLYEAGIIDGKGKILDKNAYKKLKEFSKRGILKSIINTFKGIGRGTASIFRKNKLSGASDDNSIVSDKKNDEEYNDNRLLIPKINFSSGKINNSDIDEVVPVYIVNETIVNEKLETILNGISGIIEKYNKTKTEETKEPEKQEQPVKEHSKALAGNYERVTDYKKNIGIEGEKNNFITLTRTPLDIRNEMLSDKYKYTPVSKFLDTTHESFKKQIGEKVVVSSQDLDFALKNPDFRFATGGTTFSDMYITGDARGKNIFANGAKPELVETFSASPVFSRITPIKKFADGGISEANKIVTGTQQQMAQTKSFKKKETGSKLLDAIFNRTNRQLEKEQEKLADYQMRQGMAQAIQQLGGVVPENIYTAKPKALTKALLKALKNYNKKMKEKGGSSGTTLLSSESKGMGGNTEIDTKDPIKRVFITNEFANGRELLNQIDAIKLTLTDNFSTLFTGLGGPWVMTAPMGVGAVTNPILMGTGIVNKVASTAAVAAATGAELLGAALTGAALGSFAKSNTGGHIKAATGGKITNKKNDNLIKNTPRFATGGTSELKAINSVITGDAPGKNIFAGGAKPELVKSSGDMDIIPLNRTGTEKKTKIDRMTPEERKNALATAISSHVVKFNYKLPDGVSEVSNEGEAIKVFNVKPGINDTINIDGNDVSLMGVLLGIQTQLTALLASSTTNGQLLGAVAAKPSSTVVAGGSSGAANPNPFAGGFPSSLDSILGGN